MIKKIIILLRDIVRNANKSIYTFKLYLSLKKINNFDQNIPGNILVDTIWENRLHWLKIHLVMKGIYRIYGSTFFSIKKSKRGFLTDLVLQTFKFTDSIELDENKKKTLLGKFKKNT